MRSHPDINLKATEPSLVDLRQMAMLRGSYIRESDRKLNGEPLYYVDHEVGLWTVGEIKKHFLN